jgi:DNA primase
MSDDFINELRHKARIEEIVGARVEFDRAKSNPHKGDFWGCCPFHGEKTPSFHVLTDRQSYHCFGCGAHGDVFSFIMEYEKLPFWEAAKRIAGEVGVEVPERSPEAAQRAERRKTLYDVTEAAARYFREQLRAPEGQAARDYLKGRELSEEDWAAFSLGLAPNRPDALLKTLRAQGIEQRLIEEAGLLGGTDAGETPRDFFRNRIIFPVRDPQGRVVAFGGRALSPNARAKYLNSRATPLFDKSRVLYNLDRARGAIREAGTVIVAEGYMDVIALARGGFANAVAPMGTALTADHLQTLWQLTPEPLICFDGDEAGRRAARKTLELALPMLTTGHSLKFVMLPQGQDPDDLLRSGGRAAIRGVLEKAVSLAEMIWRTAKMTTTLDTPEGRAAMDAELDRLTGLIQEQRSRYHFGQALKDRFREATDRPKTQRRAPGAPGSRPAAILTGASDRLKRSALAQGGSRAKSGSLNPYKQGGSALGGRHREQLLLHVLVNHPEVLERHIEDFAACEIFDPELKSLKTALFEAVSADPGLDREGLKGHLNARGMRDIADRLAAQDVLNCLAFAREDAPTEMAEERWLEVLARHNLAAALLQDLQEAELALANDATEENLDRLRTIRELLARHERGERVGASG